MRADVECYCCHVRLRDDPQRLQIQEVLPKAGLVYSERGNLTEVLCKPKILPIKSATLLRIEEIERQARNARSGPSDSEQ